MASEHHVSAVGEGRQVARARFRPRVIVKFRDWVEVPYEDGAEAAIAEKYGKADWSKFEAAHGKITLARLYTAVAPTELRKLVDNAAKMDEAYRPHNFLTWYTIDCPDGLRSEEFAALLRKWEFVETAYPDAVPIDPFVNPANDPLSSSQGYLDAAPGGINARFAWTISGGDGAGQNVIDLEGGWTLGHEDLVAQGGTLLFGMIVDSSRSHGTGVLGEICAADNAVGCVGIAPNIASLHVTGHSGSFSNVSDAIVAALGVLHFGDVLLLEMQTVPPAAPVFGAPIELIDDIFHTIRLASALGVIVIEAGGNGSNNLDTTTNAAGLQVLNPSSGDFRDSGAVIVGAGTSSAPHARKDFSSFGARVNCYAWGENVETTNSDVTGATNLYQAGFGGTSSASPIITGAALAVQGCFFAANGYRLSPAQMRQVLADPATGTASVTPASDLIGVMPDLQAIIQNKLGLGFSDVYMRDYVGDTGNPHSGPLSTSPDVIVRPNTVVDPQSAFGDGSGTENSEVLGYTVEAGQDNFIYTRVRNRGSSAATNAEVTVFWSEVATLVRPDMWNRIGSQTLASVPTGNILTVADPITWASGLIPASGHYCFVATVGTADDPVPPLATLDNFDNFEAFIRNNNNVTWRNFNVEDMSPNPSEPLRMDFAIAGAFDRALPMGLQVIARLPEGARLTLEAPAHLLQRLGHKGPQFEQKGHIGQLNVRPQGVQELGLFHFPAKFHAKLRLVAMLPAAARQQSGWQVAVRQYLPKDNFEVGRVAWYLAAPDFDKRRREIEAYLFRRK
jgi:serine protease